MKYAILALALTAGFSNIAFADHHAAKWRDPGINDKQQDQRHRIQQGAHSGALTKDEAKTLAQQQKALRQQERTYKSDGVMTKEERKDMHQDMHTSSKAIYDAKHNDTTR